MVAAVQGTTVFTIAITSKGERYAGSMKFPDDVAQKAGLRAGSAAVIAEYNYFTWLGYDIRPVLSAPGYVAGRVPPGFADVLIEKLLGASPRAIARD